MFINVYFFNTESNMEFDSEEGPEDADMNEEFNPVDDSQINKTEPLAINKRKRRKPRRRRIGILCKKHGSSAGQSFH